MGVGNTTMGYFVYKLLDAQKNVLYIGKTKHLKTRLNAHKSKEWFSEVQEIYYIECKNTVEMNIFEMYSIVTIRPNYNVEYMEDELPDVTCGEKEWRKYSEEDKPNVKRNNQTVNTTRKYKWKHCKACKKVKSGSSDFKRNQISDAIKDEKKIRLIEEYLRAYSYRNYLIFKIGVNLGLNISEFIDMPIKEKDKLIAKGKLTYYTVKYFKDMCISGRVRIGNKTSGSATHMSLPEQLEKILLHYIENRDDNEPMFQAKLDNTAINRVGFLIALKEAAEAFEMTEHIGYDTMRKTFGFFYHKQFNDLPSLMRILNHNKPEVTLRYIGVEQEGFKITKDTRQLVSDTEKEEFILKIIQKDKAK